VPEPPDTERRLTALEARVEDVAAEASAARQDAIAARHLAAAHDRDFADLGVKVDANRRVINALGVQTAARFDQVDARFDRVDERFNRLEAEMRAGFAETGRGFAEMRGRLDGAAAGYQHIVELLDTLLRDDQR
jgi:tetrahydromethanopterin S-methyltransferase subunit G